MEEKLKEYYKVISDNWQLFKTIIKDYEPTEKYLIKAQNFLSVDDINSFDADMKQAIMSELFRTVHGGDAYTDLLMLSRYASRINENYGVKVRIEIDAGDKKMEVTG
jgi:hypothetical protein